MFELSEVNSIKASVHLDETFWECDLVFWNEKMWTLAECVSIAKDWRSKTNNETSVSKTKVPEIANRYFKKSPKTAETKQKTIWIKKHTTWIDDNVAQLTSHLNHVEKQKNCCFFFFGNIWKRETQHLYHIKFYIYGNCYYSDIG